MKKFGYYRNELQSVVLPGEDGMERMSAILTALRAAPPHTLAGYERVTRVRDYLGGLDGLPASDVLSCARRTLRSSSARAVRNQSSSSTTPARADDGGGRSPLRRRGGT